MGESYSNADCKKFDVFQWCLPWCLSFVVLQRLPSTPQSQAKELWIAAGFVLCFLWVYDFSNAMRAPQCCELHCLEMFRVCIQKLMVFMFTSQRMTKCKDVTAAVSLVF